MNKSMNINEQTMLIFYFEEFILYYYQGLLRFYVHLIKMKCNLNYENTQIVINYSYWN